MISRADGDVTVGRLLTVVRQNRSLIRQMMARDVVGRYQGSAFGLMWSLVNPLFMLIIYAFVFSVVFNARWGVEQNESRGQFALVLFAGLILHGFVAECLIKAPRLILDHSSYVKRVVFPLEILSFVLVGSAFFHACITYVVLLAGLLVFRGGLPPTAILLPLVVAPLALGLLGVVWLLSAIGVFVRDLQQLIGMLVTALLFLTPIFFPASALPKNFQPWLNVNPLTLFVEESRAVLIWGRIPDWHSLAFAYAVAAAVAWVGYWVFQRTKKGFADVL